MNANTAKLAQAIETAINAEFAKGNDDAGWIAHAINMGAWDAAEIDLALREEHDGSGTVTGPNGLFNVAEEMNDDGSRWGWTCGTSPAPTEERPEEEWDFFGEATTVSELAQVAAAWIAR